ncbi:MAG TPA: ABC transporter permease, partial [Bryobacteraceae bacterium]
MFLRFILRALQYRKQRLFLSFSALAIAAALATVLFGIYGTVERRMRDEFSSYGANIIAVPISGKTVPLKIARAAESLGAIAAPFLVTSSPGMPNAIPVAGFIPAKTADLTQYWHVQGTRAIGPQECIAGEQLAAQLHIEIGSLVPLGPAKCTVKGIVSTGSAEDQELLVTFDTAA